MIKVKLRAVFEAVDRSGRTVAFEKETLLPFLPFKGMQYYTLTNDSDPGSESSFVVEEVTWKEGEQMVLVELTVNPHADLLAASSFGPPWVEE